MQRRFQRILFIHLTILILFSGCVNVVVRDNAQQTTLDLKGTADAILSEPAVVPTLGTPATATTAPIPTATRYVPEGELFYYNFEELPEGAEMERGPGVLFRKEAFGFSITLSGEDDYFLGAGLTDAPDGNISTYVINVSEEENTIAVIGCRVKSGMREDGRMMIADGYLADLRFDGKARLVKRQDGNEIVLGTWKSIDFLNAGELFDQMYLLCDGDRLLYMVNARVVYDVRDSELQDGDFLIGLRNAPEGGTTQVHFDKFSVFEP